jgi:6-phosphogluconolactonase
LFSCNPHGDAVTVFHAKRETGRLAFTGQYAPVDNPSPIALLELGADGQQ